MTRYFNFFPQREADQVKWFENYLKTYPEVATVFGVSNEAIETKLNDVRTQLGLTEDARQKTIDKEKSVKLKKVNLQALKEKINKDINHLKTYEGWTPEMSAKLQTDTIRVKKDLSNYQPEVELSLNGGLVQIDFTKNGASGAHIYRKLPGDAALVMAGRSTDSTFIDPLPLQTPGVPELRQYVVVLLKKDKETGLPSKVMTIVLGA